MRRSSCCCHGCRQTPEEFAQGNAHRGAGRRARLARAAAAAEGYGERVALLELVRRARPPAAPARRRSSRRRSARCGAAIAPIGIASSSPACRRAARSPRCSACGIRTSFMPSPSTRALPAAPRSRPFTAIGVMQHGPESRRRGHRNRGRARGGDRPAGSAARDPGRARSRRRAASTRSMLVRQYLRLNGHPRWTRPGCRRDRRQPRTPSARDATPGARSSTIREWRIGERLIVRHVAIDGLGHAWSGGDDALPFNDAQGPDATSLVGAFPRATHCRNIRNPDDSHWSPDACDRDEPLHDPDRRCPRDDRVLRRPAGTPARPAPAVHVSRRMAVRRRSADPARHRRTAARRAPARRHRPHGVHGDGPWRHAGQARAARHRARLPALGRRDDVAALLPRPERRAGRARLRGATNAIRADEPAHGRARPSRRRRTRRSLRAATGSRPTSACGRSPEASTWRWARTMRCSGSALASISK